MQQFYIIIGTSIILLFNISGTLPLVRSFVSARQISRTTGLEDGSVEGEPVWPLIFYCLRCGDVNAALQAAKQAGYFEKFPSLIFVEQILYLYFIVVLLWWILGDCWKRLVTTVTET